MATNCIECGKKKPFLSANYAGFNIKSDLKKYPFPERISDLVLPGDKNKDFLCADCASIRKVECSVHGIIKDGIFSLGSPPICLSCIAEDLANKNQYDAAINTLKKISTDSTQFNIAESKIGEYKQKIEENIISSAEDLANKDQYDTAINILKKIPTDSVQHESVKSTIIRYKRMKEAGIILNAEELSSQGNHVKAIELLKKVPSDSEVYGHAQSRIDEYNEKIERNILTSAENLVTRDQFNQAIEILGKIPTSSDLYKTAQTKISFINKLIEEKANKKYVEQKGRSIEITAVREQYNLKAKNTFSDAIEGRILVVYMTIKNTSEETGNLMFSSFKVSDSTGNSYAEISDYNYSIWRDEQDFKPRSTDMFPGEERPDVACFRVSPTAEGFVFQWKGKEIKL